MPIFKTTSVGTFNQTEIFVDQYTTTDATPSVAYSYAIGTNQCIKVKAEFTAMQSDVSKAASGEMMATFLRAAGNVARTASGSTGLVGTVQGNFAVTQPALDLVANTSNQTVDVAITGKAATTIIWNIKLTVSPYS